MYTVDNQTIESLKSLNDELGKLTNVTGDTSLTTASFAADGAPTPEEIDRAIATSKVSLYEYIAVTDIIEAVNNELATIVAEPPGYTLEQDSGVSAYVNPGSYALDEQCRKLLVNAANNNGSSRHQTSNASGNPNGADSYIHAYSSNQIFGFTDDGEHRGYPKVTVVSAGDVTGDGKHRFSR